ncbi:MAG: sugar transferase [Nonlabens sp.]
MSNRISFHFDISERKIFLRIIDIAAVLAALHLIGLLFNYDYFKITREHWTWPVILVVYLLFFATIFEMYNLQRASRISATLRSVISTGSIVSLLYLFTPVITPPLPQNRLEILYFWLVLTIALLLWRTVYIKLFASSRFNKKILILSSPQEASMVASSFKEVDPNYYIAGFVNTGNLSNVNNQVAGVQEISIKSANKLVKKGQVNEIVVAGSNFSVFNDDLYKWLLKLLDRGYNIREFTQVYEEITDRVPVEFIKKDFYKYFPFSRNNQNRLYRVYHRAFDIVTGLVGIIVGVILLPIIIFGNLIGNRGPLFYSQKRLGKNRKTFRIYKYRTMVVDAENAGAKYATKNDARITRFGKFMRKTRLDEFPQFYNILIGEMSIIGPRPERPVFVKELSQKIPFYTTRNVVKPGLTGWAQVMAKYGETDEDHMTKLQYDLYYIKKRSIFLDIRIIVKTISSVVFFKGQ